MRHAQHWSIQARRKRSCGKTSIGSELPERHDIHLANGEIATERGPVNLTLNISGMETEVRASAMRDLGENVVLGMKWLRREQATIDLHLGGIYFGTIQRKAVYWRQTQQKQAMCAAVQLTKENALPERSHTTKAFWTTSRKFSKRTSDSGGRT